jgi:hypothetical protein
MAKSIAVPRTPRTAYNPNRRVSGLLKAHIANLEAVRQRKLGIMPDRKPRSEGQASSYIAELTQQLHPAIENLPAPAVAVQPPLSICEPPSMKPALPRTPPRPRATTKTRPRRATSSSTGAKAAPTRRRKDTRGAKR